MKYGLKSVQKKRDEKDFNGEILVNINKKYHGTWSEIARKT